jgi:hypothetical protein
MTFFEPIHARPLSDLEKIDFIQGFDLAGLFPNKMVGCIDDLDIGAWGENDGSILRW